MQLTTLIRDAQEILNFFAQGDVTVSDARQLKPGVILMLGQHVTRTIVTAARLIADQFHDTPIVISGKRGRGTWLLECAVIRHCLLHGRKLPTELERRSEARLIEKLLIDEGVSPQVPGRSERRILLDEEAAHTRENWLFGLKYLKQLGLPEGSVILVVQADTNRRRSGETGRSVLKESNLGPMQVLTLQIPTTDLRTLCERDMAIELYRLLGLRRSPESELRVSTEFEPSTLREMPSDLRLLAEATERRWHDFLEQSPRMIDHFIGALENTPAAVGGRDESRGVDKDIA